MESALFRQGKILVIQQFEFLRYLTVLLILVTFCIYAECRFEFLLLFFERSYLFLKIAERCS